MLSDEQRQTVEDNYNLVFGYIHSRGFETDEWAGILSISLIKAVLAHDADRGELSTLFYTVARNDVINEQRRANRVDIVWARDSIEFIDYLVDVDYSAEIAIEDIVNGELELGALSKLTERELKIAQLTIDGYNQTEIGRTLGVNKSTICRTMATIKQKIMEVDQLWEY